jgi:lysyl-tRNA synthetase class 2
MSSQTTWQPSASIETLRIRASLLKTLREFFSLKKIMEVETPILCHTSVTDPFIHSIPAHFLAQPKGKEQRYHLQTSPEYAMKRLLAAGSGAIYQITKAFRQSEIGQYHNPEFTMLEWYRPGFTHHDLMDEMDELLQLVLRQAPAERMSYAKLFHTYLNIDPHYASRAELAHCAKKHDIYVNGITDCDTWLDILMSQYIQPKMNKEKPLFVYDFPASQAALARIALTEPPVASRFEVYFKGIELANGFHELQNAQEQRQRFEKNLQLRRELDLNEITIDELFLAALASGLPDCAGVALGIDRLVMLATQQDSIADVLSFEFSRV